MLDLVREGQHWPEILELAKGLEDAGVTIINTGIGWHEENTDHCYHGTSSELHLGDTQVERRVDVPLVTSNRINMPDVAEEALLAEMRTWFPWPDHSWLTLTL